MSQIVVNCPRCNAKHTTFDIKSTNLIPSQYQWQSTCEAFSVCRSCRKSTVFIAVSKSVDATKVLRERTLEKGDGSVEELVYINSYLSLKDGDSAPPPEHLPDDIRDGFLEGSRCFSVNCFNAAGTMFRFCVDIATKKFLPVDDTPGLNHRVRRDLGLRLPWLFDNKFLPEGLRDLAACIKEDGNDGAHAGNLTKDDAEDLLDFTYTLLERLYTEPAAIKLAEARRLERRQKK